MKQANRSLALAAMAFAAVTSGTVVGADPWRFRLPQAQRRYPEQSARQAMRGLRRAQGGPGLTEGANPQAVRNFPEFTGEAA